MTNFETIDISALDLVHGGADEGQQGGPNRERIRVGIQTSEGGSNINLGIDAERQRTNYAVCVRETRAAGGTPRDIKDTCGLPPA